MLVIPLLFMVLRCFPLLTFTAALLAFSSSVIMERRDGVWQEIADGCGYLDAVAEWQSDAKGGEWRARGQGMAEIWPLDHLGNPISGSGRRIWLRLRNSEDLANSSLSIGGRLKIRAALRPVQPLRSLEAISLETYPNSILWKWRSALADRLSQVSSLWTDLHAGILRALWVGDRSQLSPELNNDFQRLNLLMLLAISGLHVGMVYLGIERLLNLLGCSGPWRRALAMLFVIAYAVLSGWGPAVRRAAGLCLIAGLSFQLGRQWKWAMPNAMAGLMLMECAFDPEIVFSVAFQLTYLGVWGIILVIRNVSLEDTKLASYRVYRWLLWPMWISWGAILLSWPVVAWHFEVVPGWAWLFSGLAVTLFTPILAVVLLIGLFALVGITIPPWFWFPVDAYFSALGRCSEAYAWTFPCSPSSLRWLLPYYLGLVMIHFAWRTRQPLIGVDMPMRGGSK